MAGCRRSLLSVSIDSDPDEDEDEEEEEETFEGFGVSGRCPQSTSRYFLALVPRYLPLLQLRAFAPRILIQLLDRPLFLKHLRCPAIACR